MGSIRWGVPREFVTALKDVYGVAYFVETGTFKGETAAWASTEFEAVTTMERFPPLYAAARQRFDHLPNVRFLLGDSRDGLRQTVPTLDKTAIFWLDAHWSGEGTAGETDECPVLDEIAIARSSPLPHLILIDDARLFIEPPPPPHKPEHWPTLPDLLRALDAGRDYYVAVFEDVVIAVPIARAAAVRDWLRSQAATTDEPLLEPVPDAAIPPSPAGSMPPVAANDPGWQTSELDLGDLCRRHGIAPRGILHIGAHEGQELAEYQAMGASPVVFVEANPRVFERLRQKIAGAKDVAAVNCAISDREGTVELRVNSHDLSSSLLPLKDHREIYPGMDEVERIAVPAKTIDGLLQELDVPPETFGLLVLDIQGAEMLALRGAAGLLRQVQAVATEVNYREMYAGCPLIGELDQVLGTYGFRRVAVAHPSDPSWGDAFYVHDSAVDPAAAPPTAAATAPEPSVASVPPLPELTLTLPPLITAAEAIADGVEFPAIPPVPAGSDRPFWSVMIPTYNRATYLEATLRSVLDQGIPAEAMQIQVVNDCPDRPIQDQIAEVVRRVGGDRVEFYRHDVPNIGQTPVFNLCIARARGQWVHILHDDDVVRTGFYAALQAGIAQRDDVGAAFCRHALIDSQGEQTRVGELAQTLPGLLEQALGRLALKNTIYAASMVVRRAAYEAVGGFCAAARSCSDWEMWLRVASRYGIWYEPQALACSRIHASAWTTGLKDDGGNVLDSCRAIEVARPYLPLAQVPELVARSRDVTALIALSTAWGMFFDQRPEAARQQILAALQVSQSPTVLAAVQALQGEVNEIYIQRVELTVADLVAQTRYDLEASAAPLVSICIPTYNGEVFIEEALSCAIAQTHRPLEIIISDDNSRDRTVEIARRIQATTEVPIRIFQHAQLGLAGNWNYCMGQAAGRYIKFLMQDDWLDPDCVAALVARAEEDRSVGLVFSPRHMVLTHGAESDAGCLQVYYGCQNLHAAWTNLQPLQPGRVLAADPQFLNHMPLNKFGEPTTVLLRRRVFERIRPFDPGMTHLVDLDMWFRILGDFSVGFVDRSLSQFRLHPKQATRTNQDSGETDRDFLRLYEKMLADPEYAFLPAGVKAQVEAVRQGHELQQVRLHFPPVNPYPAPAMPVPAIAASLDPNTFPPIPPPPAGAGPRPFWSVTIPTYEPDQGYLIQTLQSVLSQDPGPALMEIEVVDDASPTVDVAAMVRQVAGDRVRFHRHPQNLGLLGNWNAAIARTRGEWIHVLHQDDFVLPGFYERMRSGLLQVGQAGAAFCRHVHVDEKGKQQFISAVEREAPGILDRWIERIGVMQRIQFPAIVVRRAVYEQLGGFSDRAASAADWEMWRRIAVHYPVWYEPQPLVAYRLHSASESTRLISTAANIADTRQSIEFAHHYLPPDQADQLTAQALTHYALYALDSARQFLRANKLDVALAHIQEALRCDRSPRVRDTLVGLLMEVQQERERSGPALEISLEAHRHGHDGPPPERLASLIQEAIAHYQADPNLQGSLDALRHVRYQLAEAWLRVAPADLPSAYTGPLGRSHRALLASPIRYEALVESEAALVQRLTPFIERGIDQPDGMRALLALMLYCRAYQLPLGTAGLTLPDWLISDFVAYRLEAPLYFQAVGEADAFYNHLTAWIATLHQQIFTHPDSPLGCSLAKFVAYRGVYTPLYFCGQTQTEVYRQRAEILARALELDGSTPHYSFGPRPGDRRRIRVGILKDHFNPQTETFTTLPAFEHLDRQQFEVILYAIQANSHPLERYCTVHGDRFVHLPQGIPQQVRTIRNDDLDVLLLGTNVTMVTNGVAALAVHRLARVQVMASSAPVTTGMRTVDAYISGNLTDAPDAQRYYTEPLIYLDGPAHCFNYSAYRPVATITPRRADWGASDRTVIFASGANFNKLIPELRETWAQILVAVPDSMLLLYPFNPNWGQDYPVAPFLRQMRATLERHGVDPRRLVVLDPFPTPSDILECLKLCDVYLDSFPFTGVNSTADPLMVGLPPVVYEGAAFRERMAAALLRSLGVVWPIATDEPAYRERAITLGRDPQLRQKLRSQITQAMAAHPIFFDSHRYSAQMGQVFAQLVAQWQPDPGAPPPNPAPTQSLSPPAPPNGALAQLFGPPATDPQGMPPPTMPPPAPPHAAIAPPPPTTPPKIQTVGGFTESELKRLNGCANLYRILPADPANVAALLAFREKLVAFWQQVPAGAIESAYKSPVGEAYRNLISADNFQATHPPTPDQQTHLQALGEQLRQLPTGPESVRHYLVAMLFYGPGSMRIEAARSRLPQWLQSDYFALYEPQTSLINP